MWDTNDETMDKNLIEETVTYSGSSRTRASSPSKATLQTTKLNVVLTNKGREIYGSWSKEKLLKLLTNKLNNSVYAGAMRTTKTSWGTINETRLQMTIYSGLYGTNVLKELQKKGMSIHEIIKAMKLGLSGLNQSEILYYQNFMVELYMLEHGSPAWKNFSEELILSLKPTGLSSTKCWEIIVYGVALQNPTVIRHLILSGIDVPGILKWQSTVNIASPKVIEFLRHVGIEEHDVKLIEQYGIDEETEQMLVDLGLNEIGTLSMEEEVICKCSLTLLEQTCHCLDAREKIGQESMPESKSSYSNIMGHFDLYGCQYHVLAQNKTEAEINAERKDYLRQNIMVPVAWAMARALRYKPTDPIYYMGYQLLRWIYGNVSPADKNNLYQICALSTKLMDHKLTIKKRLKKEEHIRIQNEETIKSIPCNICKIRDELHRIKKQCWKCVKGPLRNVESCEALHACSSCKISIFAKNGEY